MKSLRRTHAACRRVARQIDEWLDARCPIALPGEASEHLRICEACRKRVTEWNAVEIRLRSLRDEWPYARTATPVTADSVRRAVKADSSFAGRRLAIGAAFAAVALALLTAGAVFYTHLDDQRARAVAARTVSENSSLGERAIDALQRDLPVAHTR